MRTFSRTYGIVAVLGLLPATACLRKDVTHTLYVSPAGVTWSAIEKDVRSDEADPGNRMLEEQDYILGARAGQHGVARALHLLGGNVKTTILRSDRPFTVVTDARFRDLADLADAMMKAARVRGDASIDRDGCEQTLRVRLVADHPDEEDASAIADLIGEATTYRLVLTEGRFLRAEGFTIADEGDVAVPGTPATLEDGTMRVSLTWTEGWCAPAPVTR